MSSAILDPHQFASCLIEYRCIFVCCVCCAVDAGHINNDAGWCLVTLHHQSFPLGIGHIRSDGQCLSFSISRKRVTDKICCRNEWRRPFQKGGVVERMWDAAGWRGADEMVHSRAVLEGFPSGWWRWQYIIVYHKVSLLNGTICFCKMGDAKMCAASVMGGIHCAVFRVTARRWRWDDWRTKKGSNYPATWAGLTLPIMNRAFFSLKHRLIKLAYQNYWLMNTFCFYYSYGSYMVAAGCGISREIAVQRLHPWVCFGIYTHITYTIVVCLRWHILSYRCWIWRTTVACQAIAVRLYYVLQSWSWFGGGLRWFMNILNTPHTTSDQYIMYTYCTPVNEWNIIMRGRRLWSSAVRQTGWVTHEFECQCHFKLIALMLLCVRTSHTIGYSQFWTKANVAAAAVECAAVRYQTSSSFRNL